MSIQEIINNRVARIAFTFLVVPMGHDTKADAEFLAWLNEKFPHETQKARWGTMEGRFGIGKDATRDCKTDRKQSWKWGAQRHLGG